MAKKPDIELVALTKRYGGTVAVDAVNLKIPAGSYCCLLGPSGCGKTTTLRMIAGHEEVTEGDVILGADAVPLAEGNMDGRAIASALPAQRGLRPWHVRTLLEREPGDLTVDHSHVARAALVRIGEARSRSR